MIAFQFKNVSKSFQNLSVLKDLSFRIAKGELSYIIGRSGEGKSVSLRMMVGLLRPDSGEILFEGDDFLQFSSKELTKFRKSVGVLFQHSALFDSLSVFDNIVFPKKEHSQRLWKTDARWLRAEAENILEIIGLKGTMDSMPQDLSVGERHRVALGRALITKPAILFYDEPTTGLDPIYAKKIDELIIQTKEKDPNLTAVVVSHDIHAAMRYGDHIIMLKNGSTYFQGAPDEFQNSTDTYIKQFLGGHWF
ncbi:MAG: ATP-binding cassette domain-containing protein [Proteobacteria bacterium]|nr:ATP-binding cassette domain-containing protein [Pseudomonadota bacterium]